MKKNTRFTAIVLVLLMAGGALLSCGDSTGPVEQDGQQDNIAVTETETVTETEELRDSHKLDLDALDFGGEELVS